MKDSTSSQAPGKGTTWRPLTKREVLPALPADPFPGPLVTEDAEFGVVLGGGGVPGESRCGAIGLRNGDCRMTRVLDSRYCFYHSKQQHGDIDFCQEARTLVVHSDAGKEERTVWAEVSPPALYPVYPLPASGYALLERGEVAA